MTKRAFEFLFPVAALLYVLQLSAAPLWYDESGSYLMAALPLDRLILATAGDTHPPLYLLMLHPIARLAGADPFWLRLPSLVFGLVTFWLAWRVTDDLRLSDDARAVALLLLTLSVFQLHFAQEARMYTLFAALVLGALWAALRMRLLLFTLLSALALYTHNYGLIYLVVNSGVLAFMLWRAHRRHAISSALFQSGVCVAAALLLWSPWALVLLGQMRAIADWYWIQPITVGGVAYVLYQFFFGFTLPEWLQPTGVIIAIGALTWSVVKALRQRPWPALVLAWLALAPLALVLASSFAWRPILLFRGFAPSVPMLFALLGWAITDGARRWRPAYALAVLVPAMAAAVAGHYLWNVGHKTSAQPYTELIRARWQPGDIVIHGNEGTLLEMSANGPDLRQYVLPHCEQGNIGGLSLQTQAALGFTELSPGTQWSRAWVFVSLPPTVTQCNEDRTLAWLNARPHHLAFAVRNDEFVEANIWLVQP